MVPLMNRLPLVAAALTLALATAPAPGPAHATSIQKCQSADGSIGYTDGSCKVFGADSTAISSRLLDTPSDTHAAFAYRGADGVLRVLHAPLSGGVVEVTRATLPEYVAAIRRSTGILIARPLRG